MKKTALITGASSGIGAEFARRFAGRGYDLVITGRRKELLEAVASEVREKSGVRVETVIVELTDENAVKSLEEKIRGMEDLEILVNNAGFGSREPTFADTPIETVVAMLRVHDEVPVRLMHAALPAMLKRNSGVIINVCSIAGFVVGPGSAMYNSTKAMLASATESLALELRGTGIKIQALCPGFTFSDFHKKKGWPPDAPMYRKFVTAEHVVKCSLKHIDSGGKNIVVIPGIKNKFLCWAARAVPRWFLYRMALRHYAKYDRGY